VIGLILVIPQKESAQQTTTTDWFSPPQTTFSNPDPFIPPQSPRTTHNDPDPFVPTQPVSPTQTSDWFNPVVIPQKELAQQTTTTDWFPPTQTTFSNPDPFIPPQSPRTTHNSNPDPFIPPQPVILPTDMILNIPLSTISSISNPQSILSDDNNSIFGGNILQSTPAIYSAPIGSGNALIPQEKPIDLNSINPFIAPVDPYAAPLERNFTQGPALSFRSTNPFEWLDQNIAKPSPIEVDTHSPAISGVSNHVLLNPFSTDFPYVEAKISQSAEAKISQSTEAKISQSADKVTRKNSNDKISEKNAKLSVSGPINRGSVKLPKQSLTPELVRTPNTGKKCRNQKKRHSFSLKIKSSLKESSPFRFNDKSNYKEDLKLFEKLELDYGKKSKSTTLESKHKTDLDVPQKSPRSPRGLLNQPRLTADSLPPSSKLTSSESS